MIEVFIAFTKDTDIKDLEGTLEAWEMPGLEPVGIQVQPKKFEMHRRVTAENISVGDYIIAGLGSAPVEENFGELAEQELGAYPEVGLFNVRCAGMDWTLGRVVLCRKGIITHWIQPQGSQEVDVLWTHAHGQAYEHAGYKTRECPTVHYRLLAASLPS